jgi:hypothetical protein
LWGEARGVAIATFGWLGTSIGRGSALIAPAPVWAKAPVAINRHKTVNTIFMVSPKTGA